jgi:hypothetical protein
MREVFAIHHGGCETLTMSTEPLYPRYDERIRLLSARFNVSEAAIRAYAERWNINLADESWDRVTEAMISDHIMIWRTPTRRVGGGYLGDDSGQGSSGGPEKLMKPPPTELSSRELRRWTAADVRRSRPNELLPRLRWEVRYYAEREGPFAAARQFIGRVAGKLIGE